MRIARAARSTPLLIISGLAAVALLASWLLHTGALPSPDDRYKVSVDFPSAASQTSGAGVRIAGIKVGKVAAVKRISAGSRIELEIDKEHAPLAVDSRASIHLRTLVGENYIGIEPGTSHTTLPDGSRLPNRGVQEYVDVDQILSSLRGPARARARELVQGLGGALEGRGVRLNRLVAEATGFVNTAVPALDTLHPDRFKLARLLDDVGVIGRRVEARGDDLRHFARTATTTFGAIGQRDAALRDVLAELPATLQRVRSTSHVLQRSSATSTPVLANLARAITDLQPTVRLLAPVAERTTGVVGELDHAAPALRSLLGDLRKASPSLAAMMPALRATLCQAGPVIDYVRPYSKDLVALLTNLGSATNFYDANGHGARLYPTIGAEAYGATSPELATALAKLQNTGAIGTVALTGYEPYPKPGAIGSSATGRGASGPADYKGGYDRVQAAC